MFKRTILFCSALILVLMLAGCGGGGETTVVIRGNNGYVVISGVAASGSPLSGTVYLKDSSSPAKELSAPIAADGSFSFDVKGLTAPFLLKVPPPTVSNGPGWYSFAATAGVANINPLSNLALVVAYGSDDLAGLYNAPDPIKMQSIMNALPGAITTVQKVLHPTLAKFGAAGVNFISDFYVANHQGLDLLLDMAVFGAGNGYVTICDIPANYVLILPLSIFKTESIDIIDVPIPAVGSVLVWPGVSTAEPNGAVKLTAVVVGTANQQVTWSVVESNGGIVRNDGYYRAPATTGIYHVKATSAADPTRSTTVPVVVGVANCINLVPIGPGVFNLQAINLANVAGIDVTITYDASSLANPQITRGTFVPGALMATDTVQPGTMRLAFLNAQAFSGSGTLATIGFDVLGASPYRIRSLSASLIDAQGRPLATTVLFDPPAVPALPPPATTGGAPTSTGAGPAPLAIQQ
jgi:hypothetical protein